MVSTVRVKTEQKRRKIIEVATRVFRANGFAGASMAEIAAQLGGSKGTLYSYFPSKEALFAAVMIELARRFADPIFQDLEKARDGRTAIRTFARQLVRALASPEILDFKRMLAAEGARSGLGKLCSADTRANYQSKFAEFVRRQISSGAFRESDPARAATHLEGLCSAGPVHDLLEGVVDAVPEAELLAAADAAAEVFLRAYACEPIQRARKRSRKPASRRMVAATQ